MTDITLAALRARIVEVGECWEWTGYASSGKFPQWSVGGKLLPTRRVVWQAVHGPIKRGLQIGVKCQSALCVHPEHLTARTRRQAMKGVPVSAASRAKITRTKRAQSNLTMDIVRAIRASDEPGRVIEAKYGLKPGYASHLRCARAWVDNEGPFSGLISRALAAGGAA